MSIPRERRLSAVADYRDMGLDVFPYDAEGVPFVDWPNPLLAQSEQRSRLVLEPWVSTFGVVLDGRHVVVDVDADRGGDLAAVEAVLGPLPPTHTVRTPSGVGNLHLLFKVEGAPLRTSKVLGREFPGVDFLGLGSHVKGATSWRRVNHQKHSGDYLAVSYTRQEPLLKPAPLPDRWRAAWESAQPESESDLWALEESEAVEQLGKIRLTPQQKNRMRKWQRLSLGKIAKAVDGGRFEAMSRHALAVYRIGATLGQDFDKLDVKVKGAYYRSGGAESEKYLDGLLRPTRLVALKHPKPPPWVSEYHAQAAEMINEWRDACYSAFSPRAEFKRRVIDALASEANTEGNISTALSLIVTRYGLGEHEDTREVVQELREIGLLVKIGESYTATAGWMVNHFSVSKPRVTRR